MRWVFVLAFGGVGLLVLSLGIGWGVKRFRLASQGQRTMGTLVRFEAVESTTTREGRSERTVSHYPIVEFQSADGSTHTFRGSTGSSTPSLSPGARVEVVYRRENPSEAQLTAFEHLWLGPLAVGIFGAFFLGAGLAAFVLIGDSDQTFGPEFQNRMRRGELMELGRGVKTTAVVRAVEPLKRWGRVKGYVVVCAGAGREAPFLSAPLAVDPGARLIGRSVDVYADPYRADKYYVHLDPLILPTTETPE